ncbi:MAG: outer membrane protein assembly factor BamD [Arenicella sp.]|nr:outer membrane protein assembly factor BamD [Arenicella sp.]
MSLFQAIESISISTSASFSAPAWQKRPATRCYKLILLVCIAATVTVCGGNKKKGGIDEDLAQQQLQELYDKGKTALDKGNYGFAIDFYRALEANYPYGELTEQAKLDMLFAFDKTSQVEKAVEAADNFIKLYPTHKNVDYAYYMKGVASFEKKAGKIDKFIKGGNTLRDPKPLRDSQNAFQELIKRYPDSVYTEDAEQRIVFIRNALAERELYIAQFYFNNETYVATVNRCKTIIYKYETSPAVEGSLILMEKAYIEMGLDELALSTRTVLNQNFPQNKQVPYKKKKGFFARLNPF